MLLEAKAAALHPERYQSLLSKLSTIRNQIDRKVDRQVIDRQIEDRQTGRDKVDER
jgi:hypothetical protein